jgi:signal transduction histidine kinase
MVTVLRDITREVEVDRAKSEFITTVSHELRTPMTSIKGYTELLLTQAMGPLNDQQTRFLEITQRNAERLSSLINDLPDVSRIEAGKVALNLQKVQLQDLAYQVYDTMLIRANEKGLDLRLEAMANLPMVTADSDRITQVLMNLVGNAIAYTEKGSVTICLAQTNGTVQVAVKDSGIGISPADMPHIFERFHRSEHNVVQANSGSGLGLSIVKTFIEMHDGRIWVESEPGKGTTFTFILEAT